MPSASPSTRSDERLPLLLADHPALDFLNSQATPGGTRVEWLDDGGALVRWLAAAGLVGPEAGEVFAESLTAERGDDLAASARFLREWLRGFVAQHAGRTLTASALAGLGPLNALLAEDAAYRQVQASGGALAWADARRRSPAQALLQPLASAIGDLVCQADFRRVRPCEGQGCTLWFLDRTKGARRRWCSMALCGNRAKASAHRIRRREGAAVLAGKGT